MFYARALVVSGVLQSHGRYTYLPIIERTDYAWPEGHRLAVYVGLNLEHFSFGAGLGAALAPHTEEPDVLNYAWRDYGNRVGVWRLLDLFNVLSLPIGVLVNTAIYDYCPTVMDAFRKRGDEIIAHGYTNSERQGQMCEATERRLIRECAERIEREEGRPPLGWLSPWISESAVTPDLLQECGFSYTLNWCHDDQPTRLSTRGGSLCSIPYPQEVNDIPAVMARLATGDQFAGMIIDTYDEMLIQSASQPLVMGIALHPYIVGQPHRLRHLRRALTYIANDGRAWITSPGKIASYVEHLGVA